jgi:hypothetical protein
MIIWRGWGILAPVLIFGGLLAAQLVVDSIMGRGTYSSNSTLYGGIGAIAGGVATYLVGRWLERRNPPKRLVDPETGSDVVLKSHNDLFFIPMKTWGLIGIAGGALFVLSGGFGINL